MAYAQRDYQQKLGNCNLTIAQVGCFLTSFCNLEQRFGRDVNPPTLNDIFKANNLFINYCDLAWSSIGRYDSNTTLVTTGMGVPPNSNAIVEFLYGNNNTHFCLVNDVASHTIIDSWDGQVKDWDYYGGPKVWATYNNKGDDMPGVADTYTVQALAEAILGRTAAGDQNLLNNVGRPVNDVIDTMRSYPEAKLRAFKANNYDKDVAAGTGNFKLYSGSALYTKG